MELTFGDYYIQVLDTTKPLKFFNLLDKNRSRLQDYFAGTINENKTLIETKKYCQLLEERIKNKSYFPYIIAEKDTNKYVGLVDVKNISWDIPKAELGYLIDSDFEGKGIVSRSLKLVIDYLIKSYKFKKLLCRVSSSNLSSISVVMRNGFELEGTIRRDYKTTNSGIVDLCYYGRIFDFNE